MIQKRFFLWNKKSQKKIRLNFEALLINSRSLRNFHVVIANC